MKERHAQDIEVPGFKSLKLQNQVKIENVEIPKNFSVSQLPREGFVRIHGPGERLLIVLRSICCPDPKRDDVTRQRKNKEGLDKTGLAKKLTYLDLGHGNYRRRSKIREFEIFGTSGTFSAPQLLRGGIFPRHGRLCVCGGGALLNVLRSICFYGPKGK